MARGPRKTGSAHRKPPAPELDAMASVAISRFVVLASHKIREEPGAHAQLENLLMG